MIGEKAIATIRDQVETLTNDYVAEMDSAFDPESGINIPFRAEIKPAVAKVS